VRFCPDANVVVAWLIREERTERVDDFWQNLGAGDELIGAQLLIPEVTSVIREKAYEQVISHEQATQMLDQVLSLSIQTCLLPGQFRLAMEIANQTNRYKAYDMQYVAVAVLERCEMVTLDGGVYQAAREQRIDARLLR